MGRDFQNNIMHKNTKQLHSLMKRHKLTAAQVAKMLGREINTVRVWRVRETVRVIPDDTLELLTLKLRQQRASSGARG